MNTTHYLTLLIGELVITQATLQAQLEAVTAERDALLKPHRVPWTASAPTDVPGTVTHTVTAG